MLNGFFINSLISVAAGYMAVRLSSSDWGTLFLIKSFMLYLVLVMADL